MADRDKTAVLLIHGIGEQRPMETLWSFMDAAWVEDEDIIDPEMSAIYSKPGEIETNFELRRVTTRGDKHTGRRYDFYEYYWAHMMLGNTARDVWSWLRSLFFRSKSDVPPEYHCYWYAGQGITLLLIAGYIGWLWAADALGPLTAAASLLIPPIAGLVLGRLVPVVGDAARYLQPDPRNVEARQRIRAEGVALLWKLHATGDYDRIIVVGHSLGAMVGYDIMTHAWSQIDPDVLEEQHTRSEDLRGALDALEAAGAALFEDEKVGDRLFPLEDEHQRAANRTTYRNAQRNYRRALAAQDKPVWLVSDFVTLGAPLGKADILLARTEPLFHKRKMRREFPTCPPKYEYWAKNPVVKQFSYPRAAPIRVPHHAAVYGPTVWSNIYFPTRRLVLGDPIAGAAAPHFGPGVRDTELPYRAWTFQHLDYWKLSSHYDPRSKDEARSSDAQDEPFEDPIAQAAVAALRKALNLRDLDGL
ncbi:MAG: hypothetical protein AAFR88_03780 [Pseudomonadota bacterium]